MRTKKLPRLILLTLGAVLTKKIISKSFPKVRLWFQKKHPKSMEHKATALTVRYSQDSERLWEPGPPCTRTKVKFTYRSKYHNAYNEPVFYVKEDEPNRIQPVVTGNMPGFYHAYPGGLNIDPQTGEIDINNSDAGVRYTIEFTPCGADCVVRTQVVISGIGYEGGFFSLSSPGELHIRPFYFGSNSPDEQVPSQEVPARKTPEGTFGLNPEPNRKPTADLLLAQYGLNPRSAVIDLREIIRSGALGFRRNPDGSCDGFPENGTSRDFTIYYRLNSGPGAGLLNKTKVRIHFFDTEADLTDARKGRIRQQNNSIFRRSLPLAVLPGLSGAFLTDSSWEALTAFLTALTSFLFLMPKAKESSSPLTPPEICIGR